MSDIITLNEYATILDDHASAMIQGAMMREKVHELYQQVSDGAITGEDAAKTLRDYKEQLPELIKKELLAVNEVKEAIALDAMNSALDNKLMHHETDRLLVQWHEGKINSLGMISELKDFIELMKRAKNYGDDTITLNQLIAALDQQTQRHKRAVKIAVEAERRMCAILAEGYWTSLTGSMEEPSECKRIGKHIAINIRARGE